MGLARIGAVALGLSLLAAPSLAQDNRELGKTPAQLFASDCAVCHKSAQGLSKGGGLFGLQGFLREHYTTSRETAGMLAAYLQQVDRAAPPQQQQRRGSTTTKRQPKDDKPKPGETKSSDKPAETKPAPSEAKAPEPKALESKPVEPKAAEPTPAPVDAKPPESKSEPAPKSE